jgi:hypothetical protein
MYPVLGQKVQIKTKMLQTIVNIRNYKNSSWDDIIDVDFVPLYFHAFAELEYLLLNVEKKNFRPFVDPVSKFVCWTDALDVAAGGCIIPMKFNQAQVPVTLDNILLNDSMKYVKLGRHVSLHPEAYPWSQVDKLYRRDMIDSLVESTKDILI